MSRGPQRALSTLEHDAAELIRAGMVTLNAKLVGVEDEQLINRVVELWGFFWDQVLPYVEGVCYLILLVSPRTNNLNVLLLDIPSVADVRTPDKITPHTQASSFYLTHNSRGEPNTSSGHIFRVCFFNAY